MTAVCDLDRRQLLIVNDRFGLYPTYYSKSPQGFAFAPEVKALLSLPWVARDLDEVALAQYVRFQHLLGTRTFFSAATLLAPASVLRVELDSLAVQHTRYWTWNDIAYAPDIKFEDAADQTAYLLKAAVRRMSSGDHQLGVFLSGGLDSRMLLGAVGRRPVASVTFGHPDCRDVRLAARIASAAGSSHHWFPFHDGRWVLAIADDHLDLTEGFHSWIHAHGMSVLPSARNFMQVNLTGWDGGTVMGYPTDFEPPLIDPIDNAALTGSIFERLTGEWTWPSVSEAEEGHLFPARTRTRLRGLALDSFREELSPFLGLRRDLRSQAFYVTNHCGRFTTHMVTFQRSHIEVRCPFFDYGLIDFVYSLPQQHRRERRLGRAVLHRVSPGLTRIPHDVDNVVPDQRSWFRAAHASWVKVKRRINRHVIKAFPEWATLYADYEGYLRSDLRSWAESILLGDSTISRGIFDPDAVRSLWERHQSGREIHTIGKLAPLMTYEMMLRRLVD